MRTEHLRLLTKSLRPLPDKWHGLTATDTRYRQREIDLLANPDSRRVFDIRFKAIAAMRALLAAEEFVEVDTPILQPQAGGALARPFLTHANALDIDLSLRIAPELYLKRLVVGGYERVFEIARNFRNEGIDTRHSPEFTALEAYRAFGDVSDAMDLSERLIVDAAERISCLTTRTRPSDPYTDSDAAQRKERSRCTERLGCHRATWTPTSDPDTGKRLGCHRST